VPDESKSSFASGASATASYYKDQPMSRSQEVKAQLRNLSTGGAGVQLFGKDNQPPKIDTEDRLRVQLSARDQILILEGRMRGPGHPGNDNSIITGIQFKKIEDDLYGRKMLATADAPNRRIAARRNPQPCGSA
jgi:hypothetical protein